MAEVPEVFNQPGAAFVLIRTGIKFPPIEYGWQLPENAHAFDEARAHNGNIGVLAGNGFLGLDQDKPDAFEGLALPITTMWETRPGRFGLWFTYKDSAANALAKYSKKPEQAQLKLFKDGKPVGEVKLQRTYQVIPPSWKSLEDGQRADYRLLTGSTPAEISLTWLLSELQRIGITFGSKLEQNAARLESMTRNARKARAETDDQRARRYAEAALEGEIENVRSAPKGHRNDQLNKSSYALGQFVAAGLLSESEVARALTAVAEDDEPEKIPVTIRSGLEAGARHPREIPEQTAPITDREALKAALETNPEDLAALEELSRLPPIGAAKLLGEVRLPKGVKPALVLKEVERLRKANLDSQEAAEEPPKSSPEDEEAARAILENGDPIGACLEYVTGKICGSERQARALLLAAYSAYLPADDRLYADAIGSSQSGKSATSVTVLETFPPENVIVASETSPKSLYYLAAKTPERLKDAIVYVDDSRPEHIPVLKTFRNEGNVTPRNLTVSDGEVLELVVKHRPVVLASSVNPLRDHEDQATSRTFLVTFPAISAEEERAVREAIRQRSRAGAILSQKEDGRIEILRAMARVLRDEGIRNVLVPFDAEEPKWADRRGTGQFQRMIKVSAFINQYQRPVLELKDGRRFVLAVYEDLKLAAQVWFDFAEGQRFKISPKAARSSKLYLQAGRE